MLAVRPARYPRAAEKKFGRDDGDSARLRYFEAVTDKLPTLENGADRSRKFPNIGLQQIPGSKAEGALHDFRRWLLTQKNDFCVWGYFANSATGFHTIQFWKGQIQQNQIRLEFLCSLDGL